MGRLIGRRTARERARLARRAWTHASGLPLLRSVPAGPRGLRTRNVFSATLHPASAGPRHPDQELARTAARVARPSVQLPRLLRPGRRHHAFHTGARRWNRGHSSDLAKSTNSNRKGLEGRLSPTFPREQNPELYSSTLYGKDVRPAEANHRSMLANSAIGVKGEQTRSGGIELGIVNFLQMEQTATPHLRPN